MKNRHCHFILKTSNRYELYIIYLIFYFLSTEYRQVNNGYIKNTTYTVFTTTKKYFRLFIKNIDINKKCIIENLRTKTESLL